MTLMELINESAVQNVTIWNPASLLQTITLPVYQALITSAPTPNINEPPHRIGWRPLDESGRRRGRDQGLKRGAKDGLYLRNMENRVDFIKLGGQFESYHDRTEHLSHNKWFNIFGSQFTCGKSEVNVFGRRPDLLTTLVML